MKIIFFGSAEFSIPALKVLASSGHDLIAVVTQPDRQKGRGLKVSAHPLEQTAKDHDIKVLKFEDINSPEPIALLKGLGADLFIVIAFGQILSQRLLDIPSLYSINIHASLLPKYRGAAPVQWALINGERRTGISIIRMNASLDKGDIISQEAVGIEEDDDAGLLSQRLAALGADLLMRTMDMIDSGNVRFTRQDDTLSSYAPKLKKDDGIIKWEMHAQGIVDLIKGCSIWPGAYTYFDGRLLKILKAEASSSTQEARAGSVVRADKDGIVVACGSGSVIIRRLQLEGKRPLSADEFIRGNRITNGTVFV